mgnify:CR=1 FL=1
MINSIRHVGIVCDDIEASLNFYKKFGFKVVSDNIENKKIIGELLNLKDPDLRTIKLQDKNNFILELLYFNFYDTFKGIELRNIFTPGITHIALTVSSLKDIIEVIKDDVVFLSDPKHSPDGKVKLVFCQAMDKVFLELVEEVK